MRLLAIRVVRTQLRIAIATRHNLVIRTFDQRLLARGKRKKVSLMACLHKVLTFLHAMLRDGQPWRGATATVT